MKQQQNNLTNASSFVGSRQFKPTGTLGQSTLKKSKMEGYDVVEGKPPRDNFSSTLKNGKNGQNAVDNANGTKKITLDQNIEEQYIKGLQDEVKLLEYELKLLKDKETEEQTNFTSFFKYFNDGVPINDNIIAMKNVYSHTQRNLSESLTKNQQELDEILVENQTIEEETAEYEEKYKELEEIITKKEDTFQKEYFKYENMFYNEIYNFKEADPVQKDLQKKTRDFQTEIMIFNRNRDKESLIAGRKEIMDQQALEKLKRQVLYIEESILEKKKDMEDRMNTDAFEHEKSFIDEQNEILKKRILAMKTDLSMTQVKIQEQKFILENQAKDRQNEVVQRLAIMNKVFDLKEQIEDQQKMTEGLVAQKVKELERDRVRQVEQEIEHIQKRQINMIADRNDELEKQNDDIIYTKVEIEKDYLDLELEEEVLDKKIKEQQETLHQLKVDFDIATNREGELSELVDPLSQQIENLTKDNPKRDSRVRDLEQEIIKAEQQLDLICQFKNFNIEEAKMAYQSNNQINKSIEKLLREYKKITHS